MKVKLKRVKLGRKDMRRLLEALERERVSWRALAGERSEQKPKAPLEVTAQSVEAAEAAGATTQSVTSEKLAAFWVSCMRGVRRDLTQVVAQLGDLELHMGVGDGLSRKAAVERIRVEVLRLIGTFDLPEEAACQEPPGEDVGAKGDSRLGDEVASLLGDSRLGIGRPHGFIRHPHADVPWVDMPSGLDDIT